MVPAGPVHGRGVFAGGVEGAEVDYCCFVGCVRRRGRGVDERSGCVRGRGSDGGLAENC